MDDFMHANRRLWDSWTDAHETSEFYDVEGIKSGGNRLNSIEREELGDVTGRSLLHLQCHFGLDTLSWARLGAKVTGVDFSEKAIALARRLSEETNISSTFVVSNVYDAPGVIDGQFDIVYTSYGVLSWLPDIPKWARVAAGFVRPGGLFYIAEFHPFANVFDDEAEDLRCRYPYFSSGGPGVFQSQGSYAAPDAEISLPEYYWDHTIGEVVTSLIDAGLRIEFLHEFPVTVYKGLRCMEKGADGYWRLNERDGMLPLVYSIRAVKPPLNDRP